MASIFKYLISYPKDTIVVIEICLAVIEYTSVEVGSTYACAC